MWWTLYTVWLITFQTLSFNFTFTAKYVPGLLMSLLSVSFPDVTVPPSCTRCIASSLLSDPYIFYQSLTMLTTCIIAQCIAASTSCTNTHPGSTIYAILPFQQPYFLWEPAQESTLNHFVTLHLANSLSYGTIKVYLAAVKNLRIQLVCLQDLPSMSLLQCI